MKGFFELLFAPIQPFVWHPERAFVAAMIFVGLCIAMIVIGKGKIRVKQLQPMLLAIFFWLLFALNEYIAHANKTDIRIDLLAFGPFIMGITVYAIYSFVKVLLSRE